MNLTDRIKSILTGSTVSLTAMLSDARTLPFVPKFADRFRIVKISKNTPSDLQPVMPTDLSIPYTSMKKVSAEVIGGADIVTIEVDQLARITDGAIENLARRVDRSRFRLDNIKENILSVNENPSVVFTETFDTLANTDVNETNATVRDGALRADVTAVSDIYPTSPELLVINTASKSSISTGSKLSIVAVSAGMAVSPIDGVGGSGAVARVRHSLSQSKRLNNIAFVTNPKTRLARAYGVDDAGTSHELSDPIITRSSAGNRYSFSFSGMVFRTIEAVIFSESAEIVDKQTVKAILAGGTVTTSPDIITQIKSAASAFKISATQYKAAYIYDMSVSATASYNSISDPARGVRSWQSKPIKIEGDIKTLRLSSMQNTPPGTDVAWSVSINGSSFVNIFPVNVTEIQNERLVFEPDGGCVFRFPVRRGTTYAITEGSYDGSMIRDLIKNFGGVEKVVGTIVSGPRDKIGAASYMPDVSEEIDLSGLGIVPDAPSVVDARTNAELGEKHSASVGRKIILNHRPAASPKVYVGGILATELTDTSVDDPTLAQNRYFFRWSGRELKFSREVYNVTVYYSYPVSTVVVRALLTATPSSVSGAIVQSYSLALNNI